MNKDILEVWRLVLFFKPETSLDDMTTALFNRDIRSKLEEGWKPAEIADHMKNCEEINPELDEDTALARMFRVSDAVKVRLHKEKTLHDQSTDH